MMACILCMILLPLVFSRSMVSPTPQRANGIPFLVHADNFAACKVIFFIKTCSLVMSKLETAEQGGYRFVCTLPIVLKIVSRNCGINAVIAQKFISVMCFLKNFHHPLICIRRVCITFFEDFLGTLVLPRCPMSSRMCDN
jgi:hypothetical protein